MDASTACRIVIAAPTLSLGNDIAYRIKSLSGDSDDSGVMNETTCVSWNIANKYYTATVHFKIVLFQDWSSMELDGVPAIIFAWSQDSDQSFREQFRKISKGVEAYDLDVSLAIRADALEEDDSDDLEAFCSDLGFEYIDGGWDSKSTSHGFQDSNIRDGIPGLRRAIDALSTIMWPSMIPSQNDKLKGNKGHGLFASSGDEEIVGISTLIADARTSEIDDPSQGRVPREIENLERWLEDDGGGYSVPGAHDAGTWPSGSLSSVAIPGKTPIQREMEALEKWLDDDDEGNFFSGAKGADPWPTDPLPTPSIAISTTPWGEDDMATPARSGFEDDFTEYISAPATLSPMYTGASYHSLHSVSDFGASDSEVQHGIENSTNDPELPSQSEIRATSRVIFGPPAPSRAQQGDESPDTPAFDLSRILGALQSMKEDVAEISDEGERRKAAARVALGLVYGLNGGEEDMEL